MNNKAGAILPITSFSVDFIIVPVFSYASNPANQIGGILYFTFLSKRLSHNVFDLAAFAAIQLILPDLLLFQLHMPIAKFSLHQEPFAIHHRIRKYEPLFQ